MINDELKSGDPVILTKVAAGFPKGITGRFFSHISQVMCWVEVGGSKFKMPTRCIRRHVSQRLAMEMPGFRGL